MPLLEHSVNEFVHNWKSHATNVYVYPNLEASALLEVRVGSQIVYLLDRVGPYAVRSGNARIIVHPVVETIHISHTTAPTLQTINISQLSGVGQVLEVQPGFVIVQSEVVLVVGVLDDSWKRLVVGQWVAFESVAPVHGFVLGHH